MFDVVTIGEALVLFAASESGPLADVHQFSKHTAGAETNVAIGLARMGLRVAWISRLGDDAGGVYLRRVFEAEGIDCSHAPLVSGARTGFMFKTRVDDGSDPQIEYHRRGSAASQMDPQDLDLAWMTQARHLHVSGVFAALTDTTRAAVAMAMQTMRAAGRTISFDPNLRPTLWPDTDTMRHTLNALAMHADWVLPGLEEGRLLTGLHEPADIAALYLNQGAKRVIIKCGAQGAWLAESGASCWIDALPVTHVVDTVGAGDAFAVGIVSALLEGRDLPSAVQRAHWMGSCAVQARGDSEGLPTRAQWQAAGIP